MISELTETPNMRHTHMDFLRLIPLAVLSFSTIGRCETTNSFGPAATKFSTWNSHSDAY